MTSIISKRLTPDGWEITEIEQEETHGPEHGNVTIGDSSTGSAGDSSTGDTPGTGADADGTGDPGFFGPGDSDPGNGSAKPAERRGSRARHPR